MKASAGAFLTHLIRRPLVKWLAYSYLTYLGICVLIVMPLLNWGASVGYEQQTGRKLHYNLINFNPFTLSITAYQLYDNNPDGSRLWSVEQVHINLSLIQSLANMAPTLDEVSISGLWAHPQILKDRHWIFDDILQHQAALAAANPAPAPAPDDEELPALIINHTSVGIDSLQFSDHTAEEVFHTSLDNIQFELHAFSTLIEEGQDYQLNASIGEGGELEWKGKLSLKGGYSEGTLALNKIALKPIWRYFKSQLNFTLQDANLSLGGEYQLRWKKALKWSLEQVQLTLADTKLRSGKTNQRDAEVTLNELAINGISAASDTQQVAIQDIQVDGLHLSSWNQGGDTGLARAFIIKSLTDEPAPAPVAESPAWKILISALAVKEAAVDWRSNDLNQHVFQARQLNLNLANIDTSGAQPMSIKLGTAIDQDIRLSVDGQYDLANNNGDFAADVQNLPAALANTLLAPYLNAEIVSGQLQTQTRLQVRAAELTQLTSQGTLANMNLRFTGTTGELLRWSGLAWSDARVDLTRREVDVPLLTLSGFDSRFVITKAGTTNFEGLFPASPTTATTAESAAEEKPWQVNLHKLELDKASFRFHDETLTPNFVAAVQNFSGAMTGLSSDTSKPAQFKFHGDVDGYAPVHLQGKTQPFLAEPLLDARLDFENLDLGGFSGYSSTYAGWKIDRGLLTANLHYRLHDGLIQGDNHIEMDQLLLGERVESSSAMDIPLRLALALITDENGLATLDIGISGNQNDPSFDIGKVIRQAVRNTLVKIVSAPFKWIGNLVGSKEDLGELPFNSGSSQLLTTATRKLNSLQQALKKRPELRIEMRGIYDQNSDLHGLRAAQIKQVLLEQGLDNKDIKAQNERWQEVVVAEYRKLDIDRNMDLTPVQMYEQWLQTIVIPPEALTQLAAQRSINAKQFLVQQLHIDANRVLINSNLDCTEPNLCTRRRVLLDLSDLSQVAVQKTAPDAASATAPAAVNP